MGHEMSARRALRIVSAIAGGLPIAGCPTPAPEFPASGTTEALGTDGATGDTTPEPATASSEGTTSPDMPNTTESNATDDAAPSVGARVVFAGGTEIDLGEIDPSSDRPIGPLVLHNEGDDTAHRLSAPELDAPLSWAGGAFPGTGGTCGASLSAGASCELVLAAVPGVIGVYGRELEISYQDGTSTEAATTLLQAIAIGTTPDLVVNGSFERGPVDTAPPGWVAVAGAWTSTDEQFYEGARAAFPGPVQFGNTLAMQQTVALDPWAETIASHGMTVHLEGFARSINLLGDQWRVVAIELDARGEPSATWQSPASGSASWTPFGYEGALAPTTRSLLVELQCLANSGVNCDAWFDVVRVTLSYP